MEIFGASALVEIIVSGWLFYLVSLTSISDSSDVIVNNQLTICVVPFYQICASRESSELIIYRIFYYTRNGGKIINKQQVAKLTRVSITCALFLMKKR
jgi:hypothetical protein